MPLRYLWCPGDVHLCRGPTETSQRPGNRGGVYLALRQLQQGRQATGQSERTRQYIKGRKLDQYSAITAAVAALLTVLLSKGGAVLLQVLKHQTKAQHAEQLLDAKGYKDTVLWLSKQIDKLDGDRKIDQEKWHELRDQLHTQLLKIQVEHQKCLVEQARLEEQLRFLKEDLQLLRSDHLPQIRRDMAEIREVAATATATATQAAAAAQTPPNGPHLG